MTSLRAQLAIPAALAGIAFGFLLSIVVLHSLQTQLSTGLRQSAERQAVIVQSYLNEIRSLEVLAPTGIAVLGLNSGGEQTTILPPVSYPDFYAILSASDVPDPDEFMSKPYVGRMVTWSGSPGTKELEGIERLVVLVPTRQAALTYAEVRIRLILSVLVGVVALVLVLVSVAGRMARRVQTLMEAARVIDHPTAFPVSLDTRSDELGQLGAQLESAHATIMNNNDEIVRLQKMRSEFLANVSHEVRTPLFTLRGFLETLIDGGIDDPSVSRSFLEKAQGQARRLDLLLRDLIDISRIESGDMRFSHRYFDVSQMLREAVDDHREAAVRRGHTLELIVSEAEAVGDKDRLRQVIDNLVSNAINYCPGGTQIQVRGEVLGRAVRVSVRDNGVGIAAEHLPRLFERFYRVDADRSREQGGTGLGLAIVKHIVEAHGSKMFVESRLGSGSLFYFDLRK